MDFFFKEKKYNIYGSHPELYIIKFPRAPNTNVERRFILAVLIK